MRLRTLTDRHKELIILGTFRPCYFGAFRSEAPLDLNVSCTKTHFDLELFWRILVFCFSICGT